MSGLSKRDVELRKADRIREGSDRSSRSEQLDLGDIKVERNKKETDSKDSKLLKALLVTLT